MTANRLEDYKTLTVGAKVQYFDIANQNSPILEVLALPGTFDPRSQWADSREFMLYNPDTGQIEFTPLTAYGWRIITD